jgi:hypothetical protein
MNLCFVFFFFLIFFRPNPKDFLSKNFQSENLGEQKADIENRLFFCNENFIHFRKQIRFFLALSYPDDEIDENNVEKIGNRKFLDYLDKEDKELLSKCNIPSLPSLSSTINSPVTSALPSSSDSFRFSSSSSSSFSGSQQTTEHSSNPEPFLSSIQYSTIHQIITGFHLLI